MLAPAPRRQRRQWYTLSVDTLRTVGVLLLLGVLGLLLLGGYRQWQERGVEREAARLIEEARSLFQRLQGEGRVDAVRQEHETAFQSFEQAQAEYGRGAYRAARDSARRSLSVLRSIYEALALPGAAGEAQFIALQGTVEVRRGAGAPWEEARNRMPLQQGDFVRTSASGSAEIRFLDGTLYTVRPNTQFVVTPPPADRGRGDEREIRMEYGWVDLATSTRASRVKTPGAEARVEQDSEVFVAYERATRQGRFGTFRGRMELTSTGGDRRAVGELEQVVERGGRLSPPRPLPGRPEPLEPGQGLEVDMARVERLVLAWRPVPGAARYALQVSRNRLFTDNVIDVANRTRTRATLG
ncbi:MAG TPA: FecR domain-containing protein, partial [Thermoanaerobaculia bacterium]|nr:FecR domain-containing protein [Thermoanaerobaculia bacterium]